MERNKKIIKVSIFGILVNIVLVIFKAVVGFFTNSIAIILDAVNNLSDALSSIITIIGTKLSLKAPDKKHPYGYGRIEYFTSILIAVIVAIAGITSIKESFFKIVSQEVAEYSSVSLIIISVAILVKFFFGRYVKKQGKLLNSGSLIASGTDAVSDAFLSLSTLVSAIVSIVFNISIEGYIGILISIMILKTAIDILKDTINDMLGVRTDSSITTKIREKVLTYDGVLGVYDLVLHNYGPNKYMATAHIEVIDNMTAKEIHRLTRMISIDMFNEFGIIITIGIYASNDIGEYKKIKDYIVKTVKNYKNIIQIHGFYVDNELSEISFDAIFNFEEKNKNDVVLEIISKLKEKFPKYNFNILIDTDFSD